MTVEEKIRKYISSDILFTDNEFEYRDDDSFLEQQIIDSVGVAGLVLYIEEEFNLTVEDYEVTPDNFDSVTKLANYIRNKQK